MFFSKKSKFFALKTFKNCLKDILFKHSDDFFFIIMQQTYIKNVFCVLYFCLDIGDVYYS